VDLVGGDSAARRVGAENFIGALATALVERHADTWRRAEALSRQRTRSVNADALFEGRIAHCYPQ
jgi:hypothetical protein